MENNEALTALGTVAGNPSLSHQHADKTNRKRERIGGDLCDSKKPSLRSCVVNFFPWDKSEIASVFLPAFWCKQTTQTLSQSRKGNLSKVTRVVFSLMDLELVHLHMGMSIKKMSLHNDL